MSEKIRRYLVYNDGVEIDHREAGDHEKKVRETWCKPSDVSALESRLAEAESLLSITIGDGNVSEKETSVIVNKIKAFLNKEKK